MVPKSNVIYDITYNNVYDIAYDNVSDVVSNVISDVVSNLGIFNMVCTMSMKTMVKFNELSFELLPHPASSPDLAPSDYWLFADLKQMLQGKRFGSNEEKLRLIWRAKTNHSTQKASKS